MDRTDFTVPFGDLEIWEFHNMAEHMHPMHPHGVLFQVLSRSSAPTLPPEDSGWKDTVLVRPGEIVRTLVKFDAHEGPFVLHCHNLEHEDAGMMLNFDVTAAPTVEGPRLSVRRQVSEFIVTAPHDATAYRLEATEHLGHDALWVPVTVTPTHEIEGLAFRFPLDGSAQFFRLAKI